MSFQSPRAKSPAFWVAFPLLAVVIAGTGIWWATSQKNTLKESEAVLGAVPPSQFTMPVAAMTEDNGPKPRAIDGNGKPLEGVEVYTGKLDVRGAAADFVGKTDAGGYSKPSWQGVLIGIAPDGRLAVAREKSTDIVFGETDSLRLHVTDGHGQPVSQTKISIFPTSNQGALSQHSDLLLAGDMPYALRSRLEATTDANGLATFTKLPKGAYFRIYSDPADGFRFALRGSVKAGGTPEVVLVNDRKITGHVVDATTGKPVGLARVQLRMPKGVLWGPPDDPLRWAMTDPSGAYTFENLPDCAFGIDLGALPSPVGGRGIVSAKVNATAWVDLGLDGPAPNHYVDRDPEGSTTVELHEPLSTCDFKVLNPATVTVAIQNPKGVRLDGFSITVKGPGESQGADLDPERSEMSFLLSPGRYAILLTKFADANESVLGTVDIKAGQSQRLVCPVLAEVAHWPTIANQSVQRPGFRLDDFTAVGSDGKTYDLASLTNGKPVLLVDLTRSDKILGVAVLNRVNRMMAGRSKVVGLVAGGLPDLRAFARKHRTDFLLLSDDSQIHLYMLDDREGALLFNALLLPSGKATHLWKGISRSTLRQMELDAQRYLGVRLGLDLAAFPAKLVVGEGGLYGLPH